MLTIRIETKAVLIWRSVQVNFPPFAALPAAQADGTGCRLCAARKTKETEMNSRHVRATFYMEQAARCRSLAAVR